MTPTRYQKTISELYQLQQFSVKQGLENITALTNILSKPHVAYPVLHLAGTNGKGSTAAILQKLLAEHGLHVGLYTSPHLIDFRERIQVDDHMINRDYIIDYWQRMKSPVKKLKATFFDTTTALAFSYFRDVKIDVAVIETGLGGRLDSTNIVNSDAAILTPIHRDHTRQLGTKLKDITNEKAAIIKKGSSVFCARQHPNVLNALIPYQKNKQNWFYFDQSLDIHIQNMSAQQTVFAIHDLLRSEIIDRLLLNLAGKHQTENAALAYLAGRWYFEKLTLRFNPQKFKAVVKNVRWPGRFECISQNPNIIFDVSHNLHGFRNTLNIIGHNYNRDKCHLLIGLLNDKEYRPIARMLPNYFTNVIITEPIHDRPLSAELLFAQLNGLMPRVEIQKDCFAAYVNAVKQLAAGDTLFVMGSHFLIGALSDRNPKRT
jgi:dihydrofolate synthase/folylpolyglutamate synthase